MSSEQDTTLSLTLNIQYHTIQGSFVPTVDARELHVQLGNARHFTDWMAQRIEEYGFVREIDYLFFTKMGKTPGRQSHVYILTLDMAKELCMVERTEIGREARKYFIRCEQALHGGALAKRLEDIEEKLLALEAGSTVHAKRQPVRVPLSNHLPPPHRPVQEMAHVSEMLLSVWTTLRQAEDPITNTEIAAKTRVPLRTVQNHTKYLLQLGLIDLYEMRPSHLFMVAEQADKRAASYFQRLERIAAMMEQRQRRLFA